ncbi:hypothetical protein ACSTS3_04625 [Aquimarina muelleri]|uniref:hypothetical protein n=1 Tax=Aquimarina muelleri TaxID=279356 RepID=UPI003F687C5D
MIKKLSLLFLIIINSCGSIQPNNEISLSQKQLKQPLKLVYNSKLNDSSFVYLGFPKTILINNKKSENISIENYHVGQHPKGIDILHYKTYKYNKKLQFKKKITVKPNEKSKLDLYYCYLLKVENKKIDSLINLENEIQIVSGYKVYNIQPNKTVKDWIFKQINDSLKGKLHFSLYSKEKGFFYKSLDIELFED